MNRLSALLSAAALIVPTLAHAGPGGEQSQARRELREGKILSVRDIEKAIIPGMKGWEYLGFEYDPTVSAYRLKFLRAGNVMFVDVDARTGDILRQTR